MVTQKTVNAESLESMSLTHPKLRDFYKKGLGAFESIDKPHIDVPDTRLIFGSVALDKAALQDMPDDNRWDYALDYNGQVFFIEVHPAKASEIDTVINKVIGLSQWLSNIGSDLLSLPPIDRIFYWVSSGKTKMVPSGNQIKKLVKNKVELSGTVWRYAKLVHVK